MGKPRSTSKDAGATGEKKSGRTARACDRCRLKKAKCDGNAECRTCRATQSECTYTARRGREARHYYIQMQSVTEVALQRLYWASRRRTGFPGSVCDESKGYVTTNEILRGLGLVSDEMDEYGLPQEMIRLDGDFPKAMPVPMPIEHQPITPPAEPGDQLQRRQSSPTQGASHDQRSSFSSVSQSADTDTLEELDMDEQFSHAWSEITGLSESHGSTKHPGPRQTFGRYNRDLEYPNVGVSQSNAPNTSVAGSHPSTGHCASMHLDDQPLTCTVLPTSIRPDQVMLPATSDSYLSPWPGTFAAAREATLHIQCAMEDV